MILFYLKCILRRDYFNLEIVNFLFPGGDVPRSPSHDVYISQLIRFPRVGSNLGDFNNSTIEINF